MVLRLIVEEAVHKIVDVAGERARLSRPIVGAREHLAQVKLGRIGRARRLEAVEVRAGVVGDDRHEGVHIGEQIGKDEVHDRIVEAGCAEAARQ